MKKSPRILLPFLALLFVVMGCTEEARQQHRAEAERQKQIDAEISARKEFANKTSNKFELPGSRRCVADFYAEGVESRTLRIRPCSVLTERGEKINLRKVFDPETMREVKRLGFTTMETVQDGKTTYIPVE